MLATGVSGILRRFSQLLEEIEHFCGCGQEKVCEDCPVWGEDLKKRPCARVASIFAASYVD